MFEIMELHGDDSKMNLQEKFLVATVDGRNPKQPPGMVLKPYKQWDIYHINWLAGFCPSTVGNTSCFCNKFSSIRSVLRWGCVKRSTPKFVEAKTSLSSWWLNQPIWRISGSIPQVGVKISNVSNHHLAHCWNPSWYPSQSKSQIAAKSLHIPFHPEARRFVLQKGRFAFPFCGPHRQVSASRPVGPVDR